MYAKIFSSLYQGTLRGNSHGILVFTNLLAHCDMTGIADIHPRAIADEVGLTASEVEAALLVLEAPEAESRSPDEDGRRIVRMDAHRAWGWRIVNFLKYRAIRNEEDRREQNRLAQDRYRRKHDSKQSKPASAIVSQSKPTSAEHQHASSQSAHTEAEAETLNSSCPPVASLPPDASAEPTLGDDAAIEKHARTPTVPCPIAQIVALYHEKCPFAVRVRVMVKKREAAIRQRWAWIFRAKKADGTVRAKNADEALHWIAEYFDRAAANDFVSGRTKRTEEHAGWKPDIEYLLSDRGIRQVIERTAEQEAA
jgi:hypothetical protein